MAEVAKAYVSLLPSAKGFDKSITSQISGGVASAGKGAGLLMGGAMLAGIGVAVGGIAAVVKTGWDEVMDASKGTAQLAAGIKSTGNAAGVSVKGLNDLASSIQGFSGQTDDSIVASEQLLLTFTNIKNTKTDKIFDQATLASANMAAKMGGDASGSAIQLGKALNDPVKGITALSRVGVSFTEGQKESIKAMVKHGDVAGAQKIILKELETEFGGAAKAAGESLPGQVAIAKRSFEDLSQSIMTGIMPALSGGLSGLNGFVKGVQDSFNEGGLSKVFTDLGAKISAALPGIKVQLAAWGTALWSWIRAAVPPMLVKLGGLLSALGTWAVTVALPALAAKLVAWGKAFVEWIAPMIAPMLAKLGGLLGAVGTWAYNVGLPWLGSHLKAWGVAFINWITPIIGPLLVQLGGLLAKLGAWLWNVALPTIWAKLKVWGAAFVAWIGPMIPPVLAALGGLLLKLGGWLLTVALPAIVRKLLEWAGAFFKWVPGAIGKLMAALIPLLGRLTGWILGTALPAIVIQVAKWGVAFLGWVAKTAASLPGKLVGLLVVLTSWAQSMPGKIVSALPDLGGLLVGAGKSIVSGLIQGIGKMAGAVGHALLGLLPGPLQQFAGLLGIHSPSKVFAGFGMNIGKGLIVGIDGSRGAVAASMTGLVSLPRVGSLDFASSAQRSAAVGGSMALADGTKLILVIEDGHEMRAVIRAENRELAYQRGRAGI